MARPERKRPGASSPIVLVPEVEQVRTPSSLAQQSPATTEGSGPEVPAVPAATEPAAASTTPTGEAADQADEVSPSGDAAAAASVTEVAASAPPRTKSVARTREKKQAEAPAPEAPTIYIPPNAKTTVTMDMRTALKLRAETAVMRTQGLPGGYRSRTQLIEAALEELLVKIEAEFNNGEEFPPNISGSFRTGRPLGS